MSILDKIVLDRRLHVKEMRKLLDERSLMNIAEIASRDVVEHRFKRALEKEPIAIIAEVKKASPSRGIICRDFDHIAIAHEYERGGAAAVSVLTEEKYFMGKIDYMRDIAKHVRLPLLRKDFIIDPLQIYQTAAASASAILLIAACLTVHELRDYIKLAHQLKLDALVEVHTAGELDKALAANTQIIGVNNRDLITFKTDLKTSVELCRMMPDSVVRVSESGIQNRQDVIMLQEAGFDALLIGETLMVQEDRVAFIKELRGLSCG